MEFYIAIYVTVPTYFTCLTTTASTEGGCSTPQISRAAPTHWSSCKVCAFWVFLCTFVFFLCASLFDFFFPPFFSYRINKADVEAEFARQVKKVQDAKEDSLKQEELKAQMKDFLEVNKSSVKVCFCRYCLFYSCLGCVQEADVSLTEIKADLQELNSLCDLVAEYFCEEPSKFQLEECCSIFSSFCEKFMRAIQVNTASYIL